jgi:acyl-CoA synthetase (NDP forming)
MAQRLASYEPRGFLVTEFVDHGTDLGAELLIGLRWTDDFGPVVTLGPGGIQAEYLASHLDNGRAAAIVSATLDRDGRLEQSLAAKSFLARVTRGHRGRAPLVAADSLVDLVRRFFTFAEQWMPSKIAELEINPLVFVDGKPVALDALVRLGKPTQTLPSPRPVDKLSRLLDPESIAIMGVSTRINPGRIVLDNVLAAGFDPQRITIVKPGRESFEGCRCVPDLAALPEPVDLAILCIGASDLPTTVQEIIDRKTAESLILIAGGLGETRDSWANVEILETAIHRARDSPWQGPVINGGNCLGIRSVPGRYNSMFIPRHKLSYPDGEATPLALISQSGALAVARASRLAALNPRYVVSLGNQLDLTCADYLVHLAGDDDLRVFACYVEGFRPLDGQRWLEVAAQITDSGRTVILYRAGRTLAGGRAAASHTASIAGDYAVSRELAEAAGVLVADTHGDFEDLTHLACALDARSVAGLRLGAISNAGFECVAVADNLGRLSLAELSTTTLQELDALLAESRLETVVAARNPLDVTPIVGDAAFTEAARLVIEDAGVDLGVIGCVPLTGALQTLEQGDHHQEDVAAADSVAHRLARLWHSSTKAWVAVVDGGPPYDEMVQVLTTEGVPVFRSIDRALRLLQTYARWRLISPKSSG